jgi:regulator of cell morphogenesis and NO signaling
MKESAKVTVENMDTQTIGDLVAKDYRTAEVFEKYGIDFCCGGKVPLATACREKGIDLEKLHLDLEKAAAEPLDRSQNYAAWELPFLADYIVNTHHAYLKEHTAGISAYTHKIAQVHGAHHPEVIEIAKIFDKIAADLALHLRDEEDLLFPAIRKIVALEKAGAAHDSEDIEQLRAKLATLTHEHDEIGAAIHAIRHLAKDYAIPGDVCNTFMVTYQKLKEFEDDLHKHVHLENNILFLKAARL